MAEGTITRKEIIQDDALAWGGEYAKLMDAAIGKNKEFVSGIITMKEENEKLRKSQNQTEYQNSLNAVNLESKKTILALKEQTALELSLEKIKKEKIATSKTEIDLEVKKAKASSELSKLLADEERLSQQKLKTEKEKLVVEKELISIETKKQQLKNAGLSVSKSELDLLQKEETLKKNQLKQLQKQEDKTRKLQEASKQNISIWKEQNQLELALISTKKKNELATESTNRKLVEERLLLAQTNKLVKQEVLNRLNLGGAYEKLSRARTDAKNKLRDLIALEGESSKAVKAAAKEFEELDRKVRIADNAVGDFSKNVGNYPTFENLSQSLSDLTAAFGLITGGLAFTEVLADAYETIKIFDQGLADLRAITGATGKDLEYLKNQAIDLGKDTKGGAVQVLEAYKLIASAKPELLENVKDLNLVTEAVLTLSQASGLELPDAATRLTDAMNQFNAPAKEATKFIDALANGAKYGAAEIPDITDAMLKFGAVARSTNVSVEESTALIELLAENGLKGADAGTALRNVLLKLNAPDALPKKAQEALKDLGISFDLLKDKSIPIQQKLEALKPILNDNAKLVNVFGLENVVAAQNVIGHTDRLKELTSQMNDYGTAQEQADIETDTLQGDTDKLASTYDSLILSLNKGSGIVTGFFRAFVNGSKNALEWLIKVNSSVEEVGEKARKKGSDFVVKIFNVDKSKEELEKERNIISGEIEKTLAQINKLSKDLNNRSLLQTFNPFSKGYAVAKKEIEELYNTLGQYEGAYKKIQNKLNPQKTTTTKTDENANPSGDSNPTEKDIRDALARAKKLSDDLYNLEKQRLERKIQINQEIAKDDKESDEVRIAALEQSQQKQIELVNLTKKHYLDADKFVLEKDKLSANAKIKIKEEAANKIVDIEKKTSEEIDKINEFDAKAYEDNLKEGVTKIENAMNAELAAENDRLASLGNLEAMAEKDREKAVEEHERRVFDIKKEFAIATAKLQADNLQAELDAYKAQSDGSKESNAFILDIEKKLSDARLKLTELGLDNFKSKEVEKTKTVKEQAEEIVKVSEDMTNALGQLAAAFADAKIQKIDDEMDKNDEFYDKQIELAGNDIRQKELLETERNKKQEALEIKKRKEMTKQAQFEKALTVTKIALQTALAVISAAAATAPTFWGVAIAATIGAIQLGAALAAPIPKYKDGRKGGPAERAWVGDGGVPEVITGHDGSNPRLTPNKATLTNLGQGDIVHKSVADYNKYVRASILKGFGLENQRISEFQNNMQSDLYGKETLAELKRNTEAIKSQKFHSNNAKQIDIPHSIWAYKNTNWH